MNPWGQWAPITDEDLLEPEEVVAPVPVPPEEVPVEEVPVEAPPPLPSMPGSRYPRKPKPIYTAADWLVFHYWVMQRGHSIDSAAQAAGIVVYDALVALEERAPWIYEYMILIGPQNGSSYTNRRQRGEHLRVGGQTKGYQRTERVRYQRKGKEEKARQPDYKPTEEEARRRFLELLGDNDVNDKVDGSKRVRFKSNQARDPATGKGATDDHKCSHCNQRGHNKRLCPDLREGLNVPAGSQNSTNDDQMGYEKSTVQKESA